ncbi:M24 family metallopeptidase [soil metagenome]
MVDRVSATRGKYVDVTRIETTIAGGPYDAVIVMSPENVPYYSGFYNMDLRFIPERVHAVVWPKSGEPAFVVTERRAGTLRPGDTFISDVVTYQGEGLDSVRAMADVLKDRGVTKDRVGIEGRNFPGGHLLDLQRRLPDVLFEDAFEFLESVRLIKTPAETELLIQLAAWTTDAIDTAFAAAKLGDTERSIAARMQYELLKNGADMIAAPVFGAGKRSGNFHPVATDMPIESGMIVTTDFGGYFDGYLSDVARTAVMGKASDRQRDIFAKVSEAKHRIVDYIRPEMPASEVANFGRKAYSDLGLEFKWAIIGHSIGLGIHEAPQIYPWVDEPILPGMVMMIELGYQDYPNDSFHIEDLVVITDRGAEYRSDFSKHETLWELGI